MPRYCVNKRAPSGSWAHEVHDVDVERACLPAVENRVDLGWHATCADAVRFARAQYCGTSDGCAHCAPECHRG